MRQTPKLCPSKPSATFSNETFETKTIMIFSDQQKSVKWPCHTSWWIVSTILASVEWRLTSLDVTSWLWHPSSVSQIFRVPSTDLGSDSKSFRSWARAKWIRDGLACKDVGDLSGIYWRYSKMSIFVPLCFSMKLTHLSPVRYWFIQCYIWVYIHNGLGGHCVD